jgi:hypothetical protein
MIELEWQLLETGHCLHPEMSSRIGGSWRACEFPAFVALVRHPQQGWVLFDTGYGQAFHDATRRMPESLYRRVTPVSWLEASISRMFVMSFSRTFTGIILAA